MSAECRVRAAAATEEFGAAEVERVLDVEAYRAAVGERAHYSTTV